MSCTLSPLSHNILARLVSRIASSWAVVIKNRKWKWCSNRCKKIQVILYYCIPYIVKNLLLPIEKEPAWLGSSYQNLSPRRILLNWSPTKHLKVGPRIASPSFLSNSPPMYKSRFSIDPYNCCSLGTNCKRKPFQWNFDSEILSLINITNKLTKKIYTHFRRWHNWSKHLPWLDATKST